ncbi:phosphatase PAP2 family protein [Amycolatopsis vastitatis]|uniref:phosphatase PAP2 family protein n=1 Tax=Amycolatopsis vastitatis TaxID=1905142 RepID=UPI001F0B3042|nr:phosphatase PAP2 family protein [Amycolatopsis vastitatis]
MDGGAIDGGWYLDVLEFARATPWLHEFFQVFTNAGLVLLALVVAVAWWRARHRDAGRMAAVLWVPIAAGLAYGLSNLVKVLVEEPRPCIRYPAVPTVATCDFATDYSFPSNHVTIAVSAAVALLLVGRRALRHSGDVREWDGDPRCAAGALRHRCATFRSRPCVAVW